MILLPAIDIQDGHCVRLRRGDFDDATIFSSDPVERARMWEDEGAQALHVVDLDGAKGGNPVNLEIVEEIAKSITIPVEFGGGIRTIEDLRRIHEGPISRVILGTSAVNDENLLTLAVSLMDGELIISVDADRGIVTTHGWQQHSSVTAVHFAQYLQKVGVEHILYTDIDRDGMMLGMNLEAVRELAETVDIDIIASGGISSLDDLRHLKALNLANISSVIVGRALYEEAFTVTEARAILD